MTRIESCEQERVRATKMQNGRQHIGRARKRIRGSQKSTGDCRKAGRAGRRNSARGVQTEAVRNPRRPRSGRPQAAEKQRQIAATGLSSRTTSERGGRSASWPHRHCSTYTLSRGSVRKRAVISKHSSRSLASEQRVEGAETILNLAKIYLHMKENRRRKRFTRLRLS